MELEDGLSVGATKAGNLSRLSGGFRHWISIHAMPNFVRATRTAAQHETFRQLALTAIALKRFQLRHGYLPINLRELSPAFLRSPTYDPMSGCVLQYIVRDDGRFLLYSAGKDGRDDGGEPKFIIFRKFGMWEDADAVWPERGAQLFGGQP